jgi:hypothetical protein
MKHIKLFESFTNSDIKEIDKLEWRSYMSGYEDIKPQEINIILKLVDKNKWTLHPGYDTLQKTVSGEFKYRTTQIAFILNRSPKSRIYVDKLEDEWFLVRLQKLHPDNTFTFKFFKCDQIDSVGFLLKKLIETYFRQS